MKTLRIATRKSPLALWQANHIKTRLEKIHSGLSVELVSMVTEGDRIADVALSKMGGKGLFVKELEQAIREDRADIAVHSIKDVEANLPDDLVLGIICEREDPSDTFVSNAFDNFEEWPRHAKSGTSSLRRQCQIKLLRPDLEISVLRGNVETRIKKLDAGNYDAIILAAAGLIRLGMDDRIKAFFSTKEMIPAVGQGAIGVECRKKDDEVLELLSPLDHAETRTRVLAERAMNQHLDGGCDVPIAGHAVFEGDQLRLDGLVGEPDGSEVLKVSHTGDPNNPEGLGIKVAEDLLLQGAAEILNSNRTG